MEGIVLEEIAKPQQTIAFPYNHATNKFETSHYKPEMTSNSIPSQEVSEFLTEIESHLAGLCQDDDWKVNFFAAIVVCVLTIVCHLYLPCTIINLTAAGTAIILLLIFGSLVGLFILIREKILQLYRLENSFLLDDIKEKFGHDDLDKTASSEKGTGYTWKFPNDFPNVIKLVRDDAQGYDEEEFL